MGARQVSKETSLTIHKVYSGLVALSIFWHQQRHWHRKTIIQLHHKATQRKYYKGIDICSVWKENVHNLHNWIPYVA